LPLSAGRADFLPSSAAWKFGEKSKREIAEITLAFIAADACIDSLITRDTLETETPAIFATSLIVAVINSVRIPFHEPLQAIFKRT
jgi:hypothetical protein